MNTRVTWHALQQYLTAVRKQWVSVFCVILTVLALPPTIPIVLSFAPFKLVAGIPWSDEIKLLVEDLHESSRSFLQTSISLMAAGWGVLVLKSSNRKLLSSGQRRIAFSCANLCLLFSCISYLVLSAVICRYVEDSAVMALRSKIDNPSSPTPGFVPDLNSWYIQGFVWAQVLGLAFGACCLALTLVSNLGDSTDD